MFAMAIQIFIGGSENPHINLLWRFACGLNFTKLYGPEHHCLRIRAHIANFVEK